MTVSTKLHRVYEFAEPTPLRVEIHEMDCPCCNPPQEHALSFADLGNLAWWGMVTGTVIALLIDPSPAVHALATCFGAAS